MIKQQRDSMQMTTNKINSANAKINAAITRNTLDNNIEKIAKQLSKDAKVPGFRKGKVPMDAVKKQYGDRLVQDAEAQALRDLLDLGLKEMGIAADTLIGEPQITKFEKTDSGIEVEVTIATRPTIELGDYATMIPDVSKPVIADEVIMARIEELAGAQAPLVIIEENRPLVDGDTALIDFEGFVDGVAFEGGKAENFSLQLGGGQFIPGFEAQVVGMSKGDEKTIDVTFPENYGGEKLAGKPASFKVKVHAIQAKETTVLNDELAKKMLPGFEDATIDMLKDKVKEQLESEEMSKLYNDELKPKLMEHFVATFTIDLPEFIVEQEIDMALNKKAREMTEEQIAELRDNADKVKEMRETFRDDASRAVKATFIVDALAKAENISVNEQELMQTIYYEAMQMGQDPAAVYKNYQESGYLPAIQMAMIEDRVLSKLLNAKIK